MPNIALSPVTGSAPKWPPPPSRSSTPSPPISTYDEHPGRRRRHRPRTASRSPTRRWPPSRPPTPSCSAPSAAPSGTPTSPARSGPSRALFRLRADLGLYANLRPIRPLRALYDASPLKRELIEGVDMLIVRELTGGLYYGERGTQERPRVRHDGLHGRGDRADRPRRLSRPRSRRVTSVDKANVLDTLAAVARGRHPHPRRGVPEHRARAHPRRRVRDEADLRAAPLRGDRHREHVRRHPQSDEASMLTGSLGHAPDRVAGRQWPVAVRARPRLGARHRRPGHRQPDRHDPVRARCCCATDSAGRPRPTAVESAVDKALEKGVRSGDLGGNATTAEVTKAVLEELNVSQSMIWMNGELVPYEDAKVHVLTHALHYGTSVFEGVRAYETPDGGTGVFRHAGPHRPPVPRRPRSTTWRSRSPRTRSAAATFETITRNGLKSCYIRPLVFRGAGPMGLYPLDCPVDVIIAVWEWGAYLGDEGKLNGVRAKVSSLAADLRRRADPDGQGRRPVPELRPGQDRGRQGRLRGGDPARLPRLRLRGHGREPVPGQGRQGRPRRASPTTSSRASTARRRSRSCATRATRSSSATSPAASSTAPTRSS